MNFSCLVFHQEDRNTLQSKVQLVELIPQFHSMILLYIGNSYSCCYYQYYWKIYLEDIALEFQYPLDNTFLLDKCFQLFHQKALGSLHHLYKTNQDHTVQ